MCTGKYFTSKLIYDYVVYITFHHTSESDDDDDECGECIQ